MEEERKRHEKWMEAALESAKTALGQGEVPVGCLFVYKNQLLANGSNTVNETKNATRHAEMNCIDTVLSWCTDNSKDSTLVFREIEVIVTVEPCIMCAAALHQLGVRAIVYGCDNSRFGGCTSVLDTSTIYTDSSCNIKGGIFATEAISLLKLFYQGTNPNAPINKVKKKKLDKINSLEDQADRDDIEIEIVNLTTQE